MVKADRALDRPAPAGYVVAMVRRRTFLGALPLLAVSSSCLSTRGPTVPQGQLAPDFSLRSHDGRQVTLDGLVAQGPAVLVFYRGYW